MRPRFALALVLAVSGCTPTERGDEAATRKLLEEVDAITQRGPIGHRTPAQYFADRLEHDPNGEQQIRRFGSMYESSLEIPDWSKPVVDDARRDELEFWRASSEDLAHLAAQAARTGHIAMRVSLTKDDLETVGRRSLHFGALADRVHVLVLLERREQALRELQTLMALEQAYRPWALVDWLTSVGRIHRAWRVAGTIAANGGWSDAELQALAEMPARASRAAEACWSELAWSRGAAELHDAKDKREAAELWLEMAKACEALTEGKPTEWEYAEHDAKHRLRIASYRLVIDLVRLRKTTPLVRNGAVDPAALKLAEKHGLTLTAEPDASVKISHPSFGTSDPVILTPP